MNKMNTKIAELKEQGYSVLNYGEAQMNGRFYKTCTMVKGDEKIVVNHQGGTKGLSSTISK